MTPVLGLIFKPEGRLIAEYTSVPPLESVALSDRETLSPSVLDWSPGLVSAMGLAMFQVKTREATKVSAEARTVTSYGPWAAAPMSTGPEIAPVLGLIARPGG